MGGGDLHTGHAGCRSCDTTRPPAARATPAHVMLHCMVCVFREDVCVMGDARRESGDGCV